MQHPNIIKIIFLVSMLSTYGLVNIGFCQDNTPSPKPVSIDVESVDKNDQQKKEPDSDTWQKIKGKKPKNALLLGMWSHHLKGSGEYFGDGNSNEQNHLFGLQYEGLVAGTFIGSHDERAWFVGFAREVHSRKLNEDIRFDISYKLGPLFGYGDDLPNIGGVSAFGAGVLGFTWYKLGFDITIIPVGVVTIGFRIDIE